MTFDELGVSAPICRAITELGYQQPMPVQEAVIPYLLGEPIDLIALAQTGTGKTAAFGLPLLQNVAKAWRKSLRRAPLVPSSSALPVSYAYRSPTISQLIASTFPRCVSYQCMGVHPSKLRSAPYVVESK